MPDIDDTLGVDVPYVLKFKYLDIVGFPSPIFSGIEDNHMSGYTNIPFLEFRQSSKRNSPIVGKKIPSPFKLRLLEWYNSKPIITDFLSSRNMKRAYRLAKRDWREKRPVRNPGDIPEGWRLADVPTGEKILVSDGIDPMSGLETFKKQPVTLKRLRPSNRPWRRQSPHVALDAWVNDLDYYKQEQSVEHNFQGVITSSPGYGNGYPPSYGGHTLGYFESSGPLPETIYDDLGFTDDLLEGKTMDVVAPPDLLDSYATEIDELSYLALKRHFQKLSNQKVDLATELSQAMLTVNMIIDLAKRVAETLLFLKKGRLISAFEKLFPSSRKELANDYLVYKYGIQPLLGDIAGAAEHLADYVTKARPVKSNGHAKKTWKEIDVHEKSDHRTFDHEKEVTIRVKYSTLFKISDDLSRQAAQLGFTNPANVVWELAPFSFVADWFLPIGDYLQGLTSLNGLVVKESYKTTYISISEYFLLDYYTPSTGVEFVDSPPLNGFFNVKSVVDEYPEVATPGSTLQDHGYLFVNRVRYGRRLETTYCKREVIPIPEVPLPRFKSPISIVHLTEALALFTQLREK